MDVVFSIKETNRTQKAVGEKVNDYLCVTRKKIYNYRTGLPLFSFSFENNQTALKFAEVLNKLYDGLWVLLVWEHHDMFELAQHTVPKGQEMCQFLKHLKELDRPITRKDLKRLAQKVRNESNTQ